MYDSSNAILLTSNKSVIGDGATIGDAHSHGAFEILHDALQSFDMWLDWLVTEFGDVTNGV